MLRHYSLVEKQRVSWTLGPWPHQLQEHLREFLEGVQVKGRVQKALQLRQVRLLVARGWSGCGVSASIPETERGEATRIKSEVAPAWSSLACFQVFQAMRDLGLTRQA